MIIYLLKINVALMLLYGFYRLTVSGDTFFSLRRATLWLIYVTVLLVPTLNVAYWVKENHTMSSLAYEYAGSGLLVDAAGLNVFEFTWQDAIIGIYWLGVALLTLRLLVQLFSICKMAYESKSMEKEGIKVRVLEGKGSPFSFFRWIFIYPDAKNDAQWHEVLVHERTHAEGLHSLDCIFSELFTILCWWNPFAWWMKQEVRINLEYLADESVLADGNARKSYQYHLLGLAYRKPTRSVKIANNFSLLPLKKRIKMMNKRRTSEMGKAKYFLFAPLAAALLMASNIETVAREASKQVNNQLPKKTVVQENSSSAKHVAPLAESSKKAKQAGSITKEAKQALVNKQISPAPKHATPLVESSKKAKQAGNTAKKAKPAQTKKQTK